MNLRSPLPTRFATPILLVAGITIVAALASTGSVSLQQTIMEMFINVVLVVGLYTFSGNSGVLSFGHTSFMAIGAYVTAALTMPPLLKQQPPLGLPGFLVDAHLSLLPAALIAGVAAGLIGAIVAVPLMRLTGLAAGIGTFALFLICQDVIKNASTLTAGEESLVGIPISDTVWSTWGWAVAVVLVAFAYQTSRAGLRLRASRDNEAAAAAAGVDIRRERRIALALSAVIAGVGGALYSNLLGVLSVTDFSFAASFLIIAMLVVGGMTSLSGAVVGVGVVTLVVQGLRTVEAGTSVAGLEIPARPGMTEVGLALLLLLVLALRPRGIVGGLELRWPRTFRRGRTPAALATNPPLEITDDVA